MLGEVGVVHLVSRIEVRGDCGHNAGPVHWISLEEIVREYKCEKLIGSPPVPMRARRLAPNSPEARQKREGARIQVSSRTKIAWPGRKCVPGTGPCRTAFEA